VIDAALLKLDLSSWFPPRPRRQVQATSLNHFPPGFLVVAAGSANEGSGACFGTSHSNQRETNLSHKKEITQQLVTPQNQGSVWQGDRPAE
jgi:hypothetical protein